MVDTVPTEDLPFGTQVFSGAKRNVQPTTHWGLQTQPVGGALSPTHGPPPPGLRAGSVSGPEKADRPESSAWIGGGFSQEFGSLFFSR